MEIFYKNSENSFFKSSTQVKDIPFNRKERYNLGIDGSTTSFGVAWYTDTDTHLMQLMRSSDEGAARFMDKVFPFLHTLFYQVEFNIGTYEKTPDDFETDTRMVRVMKDTEKSVGMFLRNRNLIEINDEAVFDIFPNSWKGWVVPKDLQENAGKVNKRENAKAVLRYRGLDCDQWLYELDALQGHMYDCVEALGIGLYGSEFIYCKPFVRTYRNFKRRRPLYFLGRLVNSEELAPLIENIFLLFDNIPIEMYIPNEFHSVFENIYALDNDTKLGLLITDTTSKIRPYLEHVHGLLDVDENKVLLSFTLRINKKTTNAIEPLKNTYGFKVLEI